MYQLNKTSYHQNKTYARFPQQMQVHVSICLGHFSEYTADICQTMCQIVWCASATMVCLQMCWFLLAKCPHEFIWQIGYPPISMENELRHSFSIFRNSKLQCIPTWDSSPVFPLNDMCWVSHVTWDSPWGSHGLRSHPMMVPWSRQMNASPRSLAGHFNPHKWYFILPKRWRDEEIQWDWESMG